MNTVDAIRQGIRPFQGEGRGRALFAVASGSFLLIGVQMIYPVLVPALRLEYGFSLTTAGTLLSLLWVTNAIGQLPGGMLADRIGEGRTLFLGVLLSGVTLLILISGTSVRALFAGTALLGIGLALYGVARYTAMYDMFPDHAGTSIGFVLAAADAGQSLLPPIAGIVAASVAWQLGFGFTIPLFVVVSIALWVYVPSRTAQQKRGGEELSMETIRTLLGGMRKPSIAYGTGVFVVYLAIWVSLTSFYPTYLTEVKQLSPTAAALLFGLFFAVGVLIKPLSGSLYDRVGIRRAVLVIAPIPAIGLIALPLAEGVRSLAIVTILISPILGSGTISQSFLIKRFHDDLKSTGLGVVRTCGMTVAAITPIIFGAVADRGFFDEAFLSLSALVGLLVFAVLRIPAEWTS